MDWDKSQRQQVGLLIVLIAAALVLSARLIYFYLADAKRFPINTVKVSATYDHISRDDIQQILSKYLTSSLFALPTRQLEAELTRLNWADQVDIKRIWPDTLKITLTEKKPIAEWNEFLLTESGALFSQDDSFKTDSLPKLSGPQNQYQYVLQNYQKLSKLLSIYGLQAGKLHLSDNQAWDLTLTNGIQIRLGKRDVEQRLHRFCKAYPTVFADKPEQLSSVDLRYTRGMAVQWKQPTGK